MIAFFFDAFSPLRFHAISDDADADAAAIFDFLSLFSLRRDDRFLIAAFAAIVSLPRQLPFQLPLFPCAADATPHLLMLFALRHWFVMLLRSSTRQRAENATPAREDMRERAHVAPRGAERAMRVRAL
jgi:hypothetical protein